MFFALKEIATWIRECDEALFARVFQPYENIRYWNARTQKVPDQVAGLLLTGGSDISGKYLRQPVPDPGLIEEPDPERDGWEFSALDQALKARRPILAICRGMQVLNVALDGTLHLDIPGHDDNKHDNVQPLVYEPEAEIRFERVNSSHHQALDRLGRGLRVEARSCGDGIIEQVRLENYPFALGVQYHPERDPLYRPLFDRFAEWVAGETA
jgi:putative glutamine amidotransferase